jgi:hypothetical protein
MVRWFFATLLLVGFVSAVTAGVSHHKLPPGYGACTGPNFPYRKVSITTTTRVTPANLVSVAAAATAGTLIVISPGTYNLTVALPITTGVSYQCQCGAKLIETGAGGDVIFATFSPVSNVVINNCYLGVTGSGQGNGTGAVIVGASTTSTNITVTHNTCENWANSNCVYLWNSSNVTIANNILRNGYQGITWDTNTALPSFSNIQISDNLIYNMSRYSIETGLLGTFTGVHIDRNTVWHILGGLNISVVDGGSTANLTGTIWGNISSDYPNVGGNACIEIGMVTGNVGLTLSHNICQGSVNSDNAFLVGQMATGVIEDNVMVGMTNAFVQDGGYVANSEWIGKNWINGVLTSGWAAHGPYTGAGPTRFLPSQQITW